MLQCATAPDGPAVQQAARSGLHRTRRALAARPNTRTPASLPHHLPRAPVGAVSPTFTPRRTSVPIHDSRRATPFRGNAATATGPIAHGHHRSRLPALQRVRLCSCTCRNPPSPPPPTPAPVAESGSKNNAFGVVAAHPTGASAQGGAVTSGSDGEDADEGDDGGGDDAADGWDCGCLTRFCCRRKGGHIAAGAATGLPLAIPTQSANPLVAGSGPHPPLARPGLVHVAVPSIASAATPASAVVPPGSRGRGAANAAGRQGATASGRGAAVPETISAALAAQARGSGFGLPVARMLTERLGGAYPLC
jgi:hypothetical protein